MKRADFNHKMQEIDFPRRTSYQLNWPLKTNPVKCSKYFRGKQIKETQAKSYYGKEQISYRQEGNQMPTISHPYKSNKPSEIALFLA